MAAAHLDARAGSDIDVAASFGLSAPQAFEILMPPGVDLLVLEHAPHPAITPRIRDERPGWLTTHQVTA